MTPPIQTCPLPRANSASPIVTPASVSMGAANEQLMPFGQAAKAIFVKANGLPAYYSSAGVLRYAA